MTRPPVPEAPAATGSELGQSVRVAFSFLNLRHTSAGIRKQINKTNKNNK